MLAQRELVPEDVATAKALDYSLKRWGSEDALPARFCCAHRQRPDRELDPVEGGRTGYLPGRFAAAYASGQVIYPAPQRQDMVCP